jgi:hypothetical protein
MQGETFVVGRAGEGFFQDSAQTAPTAITAMNVLRHRINPETFVITRKQLAKYLKTDPSRVWRLEKWKHVLWVHIQGIGGYFTTLPPARAMGSCLLYLNSRLPRLESTEDSLVSY